MGCFSFANLDNFLNFKFVNRKLKFISQFFKRSKKLVAFLCREVGDGIRPILFLPKSQELMHSIDELNEDQILAIIADLQELLQVDSFLPKNLSKCLLRWFCIHWISIE